MMSLHWQHDWQTLSESASKIAQSIGLFDKFLEYIWAILFLAVSSRVVLFTERRRVRLLERYDTINFSLNIYEPKGGEGEEERRQAEVTRLRAAVLEKKAEGYDSMVAASTALAGVGREGEAAAVASLVEVRRRVEALSMDLEEEERALELLQLQPRTPRPGTSGGFGGGFGGGGGGGGRRGGGLVGPYAGTPHRDMELKQRTLHECPLELVLPIGLMQSHVAELAKGCCFEDPVVALRGRREDRSVEASIRLAILNFIGGRIFPPEGYLKHAIHGEHRVVVTTFLAALTFEQQRGGGEKKYRVVVIREAQLRKIHESCKGVPVDRWLQVPQVESEILRPRLRLLRAMAHKAFAGTDDEKRSIMTLKYTSAASV